MKKALLVLFAMLALPQMATAETSTVVHLRPPFFSLAQHATGGRVMMNTFEGSPGVLWDFRRAVDNGDFSVFLFPIELRRTIADLRNSPLFVDTMRAYVMFAGEASLYFENGVFSSVNLSAGITFGHGYSSNVDHWMERFIVTLYPIYEFPLAIFWKTPHFPWKQAFELSYEFLRVGPVVAGAYVRSIFFPTRGYHEESIYGDMDLGFSIGWVF